MSKHPDLPIVYFYRKDGCELCERMAQSLNSFAQEFAAEMQIDIVERDIEGDDNWYRRYREYVPVLVVGEEEVCHYFFDRNDLMEALRCS